jgi:hypothetical protein
MANFMEIDCYVLVACPENSLIDSKVGQCEWNVKWTFPPCISTHPLLF